MPIRFILFFLCFLSYIKNSGYIKVDFTKAMTWEQDLSYLEKPEWQFIRSQYELSFQNKVISEEILIPRIIHQIWLGPKPLPKKHEKLRESWKKLHPTWEYKLWREEDLKYFKLINQDAFDRAENYGEKSDILRYEILYRIGGVYVDDDFECLQAFDELHNSCEFYAGFINSENKPVFINAIIGSRPGHSILKCCIDGIKTGSRDTILERTGPYHFTKSIFNILKISLDKSITVLPTSYFYPWPAIERGCFKKDESIKRWLKPESLAVHHWAVSWSSD